MGSYRLGTISGLELTAVSTALTGSVLAWALLAGAGVIWIGLSPFAAVVAAFFAVILHWLSEVIHQLGHAAAANRTGYPMTGIRLWWLLGSSVYPADEPALRPAIHIQRALGGPLASLLLTVLGAMFTNALRPVGGALWLLAVFFYLDNLVVFALGSLLPLGFTDGSTLLYWFRRR